MLDTLPDDVLLLILGYLDAASHIRSLALTSKRFNQLLHDEDGWRPFLRSRFPYIPLASIGKYGCNEIAESLTWQSRCWDKRSLTFKAMLPVTKNSTRPRRSIIPFQPVIDAHFNADAREELVIWGAGENIVARRRKTKVRSTNPEVTWHRCDGAKDSYVPGYDDIKALTTVENAGGRSGELGFLVGRDNGHLSLLSASRDGFGQHLADFNPLHASGPISGAAPGAVPSQNTINSVDILSRHNIVAATTKLGIFLYDLPQETGANVEPSTYLDVTDQNLENQGIALGSARWMSDNLMAIGLQGCKDPLRYVTLTPTGFETTVANKNAALETQFAIGYGKLSPSSITPIRNTAVTGGGSNMLLSCWRDGTVRLQDVRTCSPFDLVYADNIDPWSEFETLLTFGTARFVAGGVLGATVKVFDYRWPKQYYHTTALPCGDDMPYPEPHQPFSVQPMFDFPVRSCCDPIMGKRCRWHHLSREIYYRPNGNFFFSKSLPREDAHAAVTSMAKASDMSPNFYIGISGGLVEATLRDTETDAVDPNFGYDALDHKRAGRSAGYRTLDLEASLMETGDGLASANNIRSILVPPMRGKGWGRVDFERIPEGITRRHRLDSRYQIMTDFKAFSGESWWKGVDEVSWRVNRAGAHGL